MDASGCSDDPGIPGEHTMNKRIVALTMVAVLGAVCLVPMLSDDSSAESYDLRVITSYLVYADFTIVETDEKELNNWYLYMIAGGEKDETMRNFLKDPMHADAPSGDDRSSLNAHIGETARIYMYKLVGMGPIKYGGKEKWGETCLEPYDFSYYFDFGSEGKIKVTINKVTDSQGNYVDEEHVSLSCGYGSNSSGMGIWYGETEELDAGMDSLGIEIIGYRSLFYNVDLDIEGDVRSVDPPETYTVRIFPSYLFYADFTIGDTGTSILQDDCIYMIEGGRNDAAMKAFLANPRESAPPSGDDRDSLNENIGKTVRVYKSASGSVVHVGMGGKEMEFRPTYPTDIVECTIAYGGEEKEGKVCLDAYNLQDAIEAPESNTVNLRIHGVRDCNGNGIDENDVKLFTKYPGYEYMEDVTYAYTTTSLDLQNLSYCLCVGGGDSLFYDVDLQVWVTDAVGKRTYDWSLDVPGFDNKEPKDSGDSGKSSGSGKLSGSSSMIAIGACVLVIAAIAAVLLLRSRRSA